MSRDKKKAEEQPAGPPAYIMTFSDMMTLLLAFFILLQIFSTRRDPELFARGKGSFMRAIETFGLDGLLVGDPHRLRLKASRPTYRVEGPQEGEKVDRVTDAEAERIAEMIDKLRESFKMNPIIDKSNKPLLFATPVRFAPGKSKLSRRDRTHLDALWRDIASSASGGRFEIDIRGYAQETKHSMKRYSLATARAAAAEEYLSNLAERRDDNREWTFRSAGSAEDLSGGQRDLCIMVRITEL